MPKFAILSTVLVRVKVSIAKNSKKAKQPNTSDGNNLLKISKTQFVLSFGKWIKSAGLIREDFAASGIEPVGKTGNEMVFYGLRIAIFHFS